MRSLFIVFCFLKITTLGFAEFNEIFFSRLDVNHGLSQNHINCIFKDKKGFIYIGTMSGLNRYDGNNFKVYKYQPNDTASISDNYIISIVQASDDLLWIGTRNGYNIYDPKKEMFYRILPSELKNSPLTLNNISSIFCDNNKDLWFVLNEGILYYKVLQKSWKYFIHNSSDTNTISSNRISSIVQTGDNYYWLINRKGIIEKLHPKHHKVVERIYTPLYGKEENYYNLFCDSDNELWFFSNGLPLGLYRYNPSNKIFYKYEKGLPNKSLNTNIVRCLIEQKKGIIWIATDHGGINIYDKKTQRFQYIMNQPNNENSISENAITSLYADNEGIIWVGTFKKGLNYYHPNLIKFKHFKHEPSNPNSIGCDDINCFAEDKKGNIWIGTNNGGLYYYDRKSNTFRHFVNNPNDANSLPSNVILRLKVDKYNRLWIGTYYGGLSCYDGKKFKTYRHNPNNINSLADDRVWDIFIDSNNNFWVATLGGGLDLFDPQKEIFYHFKENSKNSVSSNYVLYIAEDNEKNLWLATAVGLNKLDYKTQSFQHFFHEPSNPNSLSNNNVICVLPDSRNLIWVGTREGLNILNPLTQKFDVLYKKDGLADNFIQAIVEDNLGNIWVGTPSGLTKIIVQQKGENYNYTFLNYDKSDGLQGKEFNEKSCLKLTTGEILFGGTNGFNLFNPADIRINTHVPTIVFTNFQIFNQNIQVNQKFNRRVILEQSIVETDKIVLRYSENVFSIEFAALNFLHPEKNQYLYMLEGFNKEWMKPDLKQYKVTYTNLDPGLYTFRVKASNDDGVWNDVGASLQIEILPPFWLTGYAIALYALFIIGILLLARKILLDRARMQFNLENERKEAQRLHELDMMKIKFFTNISHEFRTPLTLIITPLEKLLKKIADIEIKDQLLLIYRNSHRLLRLVNQLLDIRRMEVEEFRLNLTKADIVNFIKEIAIMFSDLAEKQNIQYEFKSNVTKLEMFFDVDKIDKIMYNLLSNAFKYTPVGGKIDIELLYFSSEENVSIEQNSKLIIKVKDTGIGIPKEQHEKIFEQFFQYETAENIYSQGSGVGLALVKEFTRLHQGEISVESEPEKGSCFTVTIPVVMENYAITEKVNELLVTSNEEIDENIQSTKSFTILLIEDNHDLRFYLKDNLRYKYNILEAYDGKQGIQIALAKIPDLIVSDIMLPEIDGIELCKKLKSDSRTSHIPIILLTAYSSKDQQLKGLDAGADDYITKPFIYEVLELRIKNLIKQRENLRKKFQRQIEISPSTVEVVSLDEIFIQKAIEIVENNFDRVDFSVEELSSAIGMSRVNLYKKLISLTGKSPIEFIRILRLKRAAQLLKGSQLTVSEVCYKVGFNNPKYFTKYFKKEFGVLPSVYAQQNNKANK